jgi:hypothetical protein
MGLSSVEVDLWPEFDRPAMLVIYRFTLSPLATLPAEMRLRIPDSAGAPNAVAAGTPDGSLINIPYDLEEAGGGWSWLVFQATTSELQVEYYDPGLVKDGSARHFEYTWPGDFAVDAFAVEVQQPVGASEMRIKPGMFSANEGRDGLMYYTLDVGSLTADQPVEITVDYQKADERLSSSGQPLESSGPLDDTALGRKSMTEVLPWLLGLLGMLLIVGGGLWYWRSGHQEPQTKRRRGSRRKPTAQGELGGVLEGEHVYCHQCGKRAASGDRFCRTCGTQLRLG